MPYFVEYVTQLLVNKYGEKTTFNGGLRVYTTIDLGEQAHAEKAVRDRLRGVGQAGTPISGALVSIDPRDGEVKAMVGGAKYGRSAKKGESTFNIATDGHRQPGSAFKPFVLAAALQKGIQPDTVFVSRKVILQQDDHTFMLVKNDFPVYAGPIDLRRAMTESDNTVYAQLTQAVHPDARRRAPRTTSASTRRSTRTCRSASAASASASRRSRWRTPTRRSPTRGARVGGSILFHTPDAGYESPTQDPISILRVDFPDGHDDVNRVKATRAMSETDALTADRRDARRRRAAVGHRHRGRAARPHGGRQDRHQLRLQGRLVRRLHAAARDRRVGRLREPGALDGDATSTGDPVFGGTYPAEIFHDFMQQALQRPAGRRLAASRPALQQNSYMVDIRRDPYVLAPIGCKGVRELIMAVHDRPSKGTSNCERGLTFVPDMTGMKRSAAARSLAERPGPRTSSGSTRRRSPARRSTASSTRCRRRACRCRSSDPVRVFIAKDVPLVRVPDVTGLDLTEAVARLQAMKFRVVIEDGATQDGRPPTAR